MSLLLLGALLLIIGVPKVHGNVLADYVTTLYPHLLSQSNNSLTYTLSRSNDSTSFVSSFCDILLTLEPDLDSCRVTVAGEAYTMTDSTRVRGSGGGGRRLLINREATDDLEPGWEYDTQKGLIQFIQERPPYKLVLRFNASFLEAKSCNELIFNECPGSSGNWTNRFILVSTITGISLSVLTLGWLWGSRKSKVLSSSMTPILICIVVGSILTYAGLLLRSVTIPGSHSCLIIPWVKELGFISTFGGLLLKVYRYLVEFRTRKAHRWIVREKDLLRYLSGLITLTTFYLLSYTATSPVPNCELSHWNTVSEIGEILFSTFALQMCWHIRNSSTNYNEKVLLLVSFILQMTACLSVTVMTLLGFNLIWVWYAKEFAVNSIVLGIVVWSKIFYFLRDKRTRSNRANTQRNIVKNNLDLNGGELPEINLDEMEIGEIRTELKRVYTQLELLRNKTMRKDNPHISKRRGGRKPTHRRFSLQKKGSREKALRRNQQRSFRYNVEDIEDSVCSIEGPSTYSEAGR